MAAPSEAEGPGSERVVVPSDLVKVLEGADRIVVTKGSRSGSVRLYETCQRSDILALAEASAVVCPGEYYHCMCSGSPAVSIFRADQLLAVITNHHGAIIRCSLWDSDAPLVDPEKWLSWFDDRGISGPREEVEWAARAEEKSAADWKRWIAAVPEGLHDIWESVNVVSARIDVSILREAIDRSIPNREAQMHALLTWFGSGSGPWSGIPAYERVAEEMLFGYDTSEIVAALDVTRMPPAEMEGAARFFAGWDFRNRRPDDLQLVPAHLKAAFFDFVKETKDQDKYRRALKVFASPQ